MNRKFNWQSFISIGLIFSFVVMFISGIILYIAPEGSLSRWIGWNVFNLTKKQWEHQHTIFSYLFVIFSVFHVFKINWGYILSYFTFEKFKMLNLKEFLVAFVITILVFVGTLRNYSPFKFVSKLGNSISGSYGKAVEMPAIPDAEKLSLNEFSKKVFNISFDELKEYLEDYSMNNVDKNTSIKEFCHLNSITPREFYISLKNRLECVDKNPDTTSHTVF